MKANYPTKQIHRKTGIGCGVKTRFRRQLRASRWDGEKFVPGELLWESAPSSNLVLDQGLQGMAKNTAGSIDTYPANSFLACRIGSGTNPVKIASGAVTFTQSGTTVTASSGFFTSAMVGGIFKYGTDTTGAEYYIASFTDSTHVEVATSATVGSPTVATVWMVQQTALQTLLYTSNTYQTGGGDCGTTIVNNVVTHKRTFTFAPQVASYNVNEIGWYKATSGTNVYGRTVLTATDVVAPTNFYVVIMELIITYTPATPSAVSNIGTNFDTAGTAAIEALTNDAIRLVASNGTVSGSTGQGVLDGSSTNNTSIGASLMIIGATWTQNANPAGTAPTLTPVTNGNFAFIQNAAYAGGSGFPFSFNLTGTYSPTTDGDTIHGIGLGRATPTVLFTIKLTTPVASPVGAFQFTVTWRVTYSRTLDNA